MAFDFKDLRFFIGKTVNAHGFTYFAFSPAIFVFFSYIFDLCSLICVHPFNLGHLRPIPYSTRKSDLRLSFSSASSAFYSLIYA
jgi:hypothetical protein